jgi:hypothetical protein
MDELKGREARLKPEFAYLYPALEGGRWESGSKSQAGSLNGAERSTGDNGLYAGGCGGGSGGRKT